MEPSVTKKVLKELEIRRSKLESDIHNMITDFSRSNPNLKITVHSEPEYFQYPDGSKELINTNTEVKLEI